MRSRERGAVLRDEAVEQHALHERAVRVVRAGAALHPLE